MSFNLSCANNNLIKSEWFAALIILVILWLYYKRQSILLLIILLLLIALYKENYKKCNHKAHNHKENFDANGLEFLPVGEQRYDLRGFPLFNRPLYDCWETEYGDCYNSNL